jgi:hypothetical protein
VLVTDLFRGLFATLPIVFDFFAFPDCPRPTRSSASLTEGVKRIVYGLDPRSRLRLYSPPIPVYLMHRFPWVSFSGFTGGLQRTPCFGVFVTMGNERTNIPWHSVRARHRCPAYQIIGSLDRVAVVIGRGGHGSRTEAHRKS